LPLFNFPYDNSLLISRLDQQTPVQSYCAYAVNKLRRHTQRVLSVQARVEAERCFTVNIISKQRQKKRVVFSKVGGL